MMLFADVIQKKRDGGELTAPEIEFFVKGLADSSIPAEQVSALAMAVVFKSMTFEETATLTTAMASSGTVLDWRSEDLGGPVIDKHSTGGVGDKVSFLLAPIAAACGCFVPMISGRGLGHTGGTLDKIESIPGYQATPDFELFKKVVKSTGCAIIGQTADLAPADRRFYAIRDITATIESIPLITASILSKKIAAGLDGLVMDVKVGSGAFMTSVERAGKLAKSIIGTAATAGLKTHALITDMNEVLGQTAGNAVEIAESIEFLTNNNRESRLNEVVAALCAEMLILTGVEKDHSAARGKVEAAITSGEAAEVFSRMVAELGGPADFLDKYTEYLPKAAICKPVRPSEVGYLAGTDAHAIGNAIIQIGGGRQQLGDELDLAVGITDIAQIGEMVGADRPLGVVHAASEGDADLAAGLIREACTISADQPAERPVIYETLTAE
ncbi:MAG: thymidine phosphorylase [Gammaproteobacteria bacterium]|nr:MAG: thymidine phosphorylase [Gammaproteobacteria bacterium]